MNQTLNLTFGQCVRALRQEKGLKQVVFSERCGFYQTYLNRIENGQANPTLNAMEVIATGPDTAPSAPAASAAAAE